MSHHPIHKHMHTHITKSNVKAAVRDDKAHMDYLKRDVKDDQRDGGKYKDINQTADEKRITYLAEDVKHDEKKEGLSRKSSSPLNESDEDKIYNLDHTNPVVDRGVSRKTSSPLNTEGNKCPASGCVQPHDGKWGVVSGKTGKFWDATYQSESSAEAGLRGYFANK